MKPRSARRGPRRATETPGTATRTSSPREPSLYPGLVLGERYEIREQLGRGGMGIVWLADDLKLRVEVALKAILPEHVTSESRRELLRSEVRAAREVVSPNVCRVFDLVVEKDHELVSMEYVDGQTLAELLEERAPLGLGEVRDLASQFLAGLEAIHRAGLVHRDFKPENVMVTPAGRVVVMDLGIAKRAEAQSGTVVGTPAYMSPEQAAGVVVDARADVFAAGVVLAEMMAPSGVGERKTRDTLREGLRADPPRVPESPWSGVIRRAVSREARDRYASARELSRALDNVTLRVEGDGERHPYPGLAAFTEKEAEHFFGREAEVEGLLRKLGPARLLGIVGPSGAGKSSFLRAGLVPALPEGWRCVVFHPRDRPFASLAQALVPELSGDAEAMGELLRIDEIDAAVSVFRRWRKRHSHVLLIADQFEELFTLSPPEVQGRFAELLGRLPLEADVHVLVSMRDDFLMRCHDHESMAPLFSEPTPLKAPTGAALRRAVVQPALGCGYRFEDEALAEELLGAVEGERGALPLLAFAASRLWEQRDRESGTLTRAAYEAIGGVGGALAQHAEATLERIGSERLPLVRELFRNLVTAQGTRAASDREELLSVFPDRRAAEETLRGLIDARLLTSYDVSGDGEGEARHRIEIVHESLLVAWPRLVRWQTQDADGAQLRDQLKQAARLWEERGRPPDLLWTGASYREFELWRERYPGQLTSLEESYTRSMVERARRQRRMRRFAVAAVVVASLSVALAVEISRRQAVRQSERADQEALRAEASKLLALAQLRLQEDPTEALALTTASLELSDTREARRFALKVLWEAPPALELSGLGVGARVPAFSPDGRWLAAVGHTREGSVWDQSGERIAVLPGHQLSPRGPNRADWGPAGVLVTGLNGFADRLHVWSLPTGERIRTIELGRRIWWQVGPEYLMTETADADPDGDALVLRRWRLPDGEAEVLGRGDRTALGASDSRFAPTGDGWLYARGSGVWLRELPTRAAAKDRLLTRHGADVDSMGPPLGHTAPMYTRDRTGELRLFTFAAGEPPGVEVIARPETAPVAIQPEPSGRWLVNFANEPMVRLWSRASWPAARPLVLRRTGSWYAALTTVHPSGDWVVSSTGYVTNLTFWPLHREIPTVVDGYSPIARPLAFAPDGRWLATIWSNNRIRLWPIGEGMRQGPRILELPERQLWSDASFDPEGRFLFVVGATGGAYLLPVDGSPPLRLAGFSADSLLNDAAISPSGARVAAAFFYGEGDRVLRVWNREGDAVRVLEMPASASDEGESEGATASRTGYEGGVTSLAFADESTLVTAGDGGIRRWDLATGTHEVVFPSRPGYSRSAVLAGNGATAVSRASRTGDFAYCAPVELVDLDEGSSRELPAFGDCTTEMALDPSGEVLVTGDQQGIIRVGRLTTEEPHLLLGHIGAISSVAISPDRRWVASTAEDKTLRLWPMPDLSRPPLHTLPHDELIAKLKSLTNFRAVRDAEASGGWRIEVGPFPGWKELPTWFVPATEPRAPAEALERAP